MFKLYTRKDCRFCEAAKSILILGEIPYEEIELEKDITRDEVKAMFPGATLLPIVTYDGAYIGGYNDLLDFLAEKKAKENGMGRF